MYSLGVTRSKSYICTEKTLELNVVYCSRALINWWMRRQIKSSDTVVTLFKIWIEVPGELTFKNPKRNTGIECSVVTRVKSCIIEHQLMDLQRAVLQETKPKGVWSRHLSGPHHLRIWFNHSRDAPVNRGAGFNRGYATWQSNTTS